MINIREMTKQDLDSVCAIENAVFSDAWTRQSFLETMDNDDSLLLTAEDEDKNILGYCCLYHALDEGEIVNVAVSQAYRKQGTGYELVSELMKRGMALGVRYFYLEVREHNLPAIKLYEKLGFSVVGTRKNFYQKPAENALIMTCDKGVN